MSGFWLLIFGLFRPQSSIRPSANTSATGGANGREVLRCVTPCNPSRGHVRTRSAPDSHSNSDPPSEDRRGDPDFSQLSSERRSSQICATSCARPRYFERIQTLSKRSCDRLHNIRPRPIRRKCVRSGRLRGLLLTFIILVLC